MIAFITAPISWCFVKSFKLFSKITGKASDEYTWVLACVNVIFLLREIQASHFNTFIGIFNCCFILVVFWISQQHTKFCKDLDRTQPHILSRFKWALTGAYWILYSALMSVMFIVMLRFVSAFSQLVFGMWALSLLLFLPSHGKFDYNKAKDKVKDLTKVRLPSYTGV